MACSQLQRGETMLRLVMATMFSFGGTDDAKGQYAPTRGDLLLRLQSELKSVDESERAEDREKRLLKLKKRIAEMRYR
jgi:hypothetical protein